MPRLLHRSVSQWIILHSGLVLCPWFFFTTEGASQLSMKACFDNKKVEKRIPKIQKIHQILRQNPLNHKMLIYQSWLNKSHHHSSTKHQVFEWNLCSCKWNIARFRENSSWNSGIKRRSYSHASGSGKEILTQLKARLHPYTPPVFPSSMWLSCFLFTWKSFSKHWCGFLITWPRVYFGPRAFCSSVNSDTLVTHGRGGSITVFILVSISFSF